MNIKQNESIIIGKYVGGEKHNSVYTAISQEMHTADTNMKRRFFGDVSDCCIDTFYSAYKDKEIISFLWMGWSKHNNSIGNWGAFCTAEEYQGQGIGRQVLEYWKSDLINCKNPPVALFCTAGTKRLTDLYGRYGFKPAIIGMESGPLYKPVGNSPNTFQQFCEEYYTETKKLYIKPATFEWRHEIDCLLKFALMDKGMDYSVDGISSILFAIINHPEKTKVILTDDNKCVGWIFDGYTVIHPKYYSNLHSMVICDDLR